MLLTGSGGLVNGELKNLDGEVSQSLSGCVQELEGATGSSFT